MGNGKISPLSQTAGETLLQFLGIKCAVCFARRGRGKGDENETAGAEKRAKAHSEVAGDGGQPRGRQGRAARSSKDALQTIFQARKASKRSWRVVCREIAGGSLIH